MANTTLDHLTSHDLPGKLTVESGRHNLPSVAVDTEACTGRLYLLGATATEWQPAGHKQVLFTSRASWFKEGHPIRGGVPICLPWFGPHATDPDAPSHGLVRNKVWNLVQTREDTQGVSVELVTNLEHLHATYRVTFGPSLHLQLIVANTSDLERRFEAALHTYFCVGDIHQVHIEGLENADYIDKMLEAKLQPAAGEPIRFTEELDRVYVDTADTCRLIDPAMGRKIVVAKAGSQSTVVWNPWSAKADRLDDMGEEEYEKMCCIETANIGQNAVVLPPGGSHEMRVTIEVERV
jgi:glucose-6-phosphate 1-epimerase